MVVDTSVLLHVLFREPEWRTSIDILAAAEARFVSVASLVEAQAVTARDRTASPEDLVRRLDDLALQLDLEVVPLSLRQSRIAREAYLRYGKGQGHPANLNYGDVMSYALAKATGEVLAFVGDDFQHTDLEVLRLPLERTGPG